MRLMAAILFREHATFTAPFIMKSSIPRLALLALHVLRTEGIWVLLNKIRRRIRVVAYRPQQPKLLRMTQQFTPLNLPVAGNKPSVSLIIPTCGRMIYTHYCLSALCNCGDKTSFEVIVVDDNPDGDTSAQLKNYGNLRLIRNQDNLGFVLSCNRGAAQARGDYLVFLNNDTQVQPGWLDALIWTLNNQPNAGLVGSRLIYLDGRQQEAGGIVFKDGTAWNYGHLDDPYRPEYSYLREPDYVSGAALAIRRELFERLGGFDPRYAPGYYEDTDLAFRVRAAGYRIFYQPLSRVLHIEGGSAGRDEHATIGMKRFQDINRKIFYDLWHHELANHGERAKELERQKERRIRRRVFVVDIYMPTPDRESGSLRLVNLFTLLMELGFKVTFAATNLEAPESYLFALQRQGIEVLYRPYVKSIARHLKAKGQEYDLVILSRADAAVELMEVARRSCPNARLVYDTVDLHFLREQRLAALTGDPTARRLAAYRRREELGLIAQADTTLVVSPVERDLLRSEAPGADVRVLSNIHHLHGSRVPFAKRRDIFFIGAFGHPPNSDAILWFCRDILPKILNQLPELKLSIIGSDPPAEIRALASSAVQIMGHVPDVKPFFDDYRLSIAPLRYGAGVKGKINQSLAHGLPVVATSVAAEGMYLEDEKSVMLADQPGDFANAVVRVYQDRVLWERLSTGGMEVMRKYFSFEAARKVLIDLMSS